MLRVLVLIAVVIAAHAQTSPYESSADDDGKVKSKWDELCAKVPGPEQANCKNAGTEWIASHKQGSAAAAKKYLDAKFVPLIRALVKPTATGTSSAIDGSLDGLGHGALWTGGVGIVHHIEEKKTHYALESTPLTAVTDGIWKAYSDKAIKIDPLFAAISETYASELSGVVTVFVRKLDINSFFYRVERPVVLKSLDAKKVTKLQFVVLEPLVTGCKREEEGLDPSTGKIKGTVTEGKPITEKAAIAYFAGKNLLCNGNDGKNTPFADAASFEKAITASGQTAALASFKQLRRRGTYHQVQKILAEIEDLEDVMN